MSWLANTSQGKTGPLTNCFNNLSWDQTLSFRFCFLYICISEPELGTCGFLGGRWALGEGGRPLKSENRKCPARIQSLQFLNLASRCEVQACGKKPLHDQLSMLSGKLCWSSLSWLTFTHKNLILILSLKLDYRSTVTYLNEALSEL